METFVVRVWTPAEGRDDDPELPLRGVVEHVASGQSGHFQEEQQLIDLIRAELARRRSQDEGKEVSHESRA